MSLLSGITTALTIVREVNELKVALGFKPTDSILSIIKQVKASTAELNAAAGVPVQGAAE